jgi:hypothetical protein
MHPLVYHLGIDEYFPNEDFEPHLFQHVAAWRRARRPSMMRRLGATLMRLIRGRDDGPTERASTQRANHLGGPAIRWG